METDSKATLLWCMNTKNKEKEMMQTTNYLPAPIDTSDVVLPESLMPLVEVMAKNVHEVWAKSRMDEGWTWGEQRNDELKQHPCLIDYNDLPESEREYDRNTAVGTLKLIVSLGFEISKRIGDNS